MEIEVFRGKIFRVTVEDYSPELRFERVYQRDGVTVIPITEKGLIRFILLTTTDNPVPRIRLMSAYIEDNESSIDCARRELAEELHLTARNLNLFATVANGRAVRKTQYFFVARGLTSFEGKACSDPHENITEFVDLSLRQVKNKVLAEEFDADHSFALLKFILRAKK